MTKILIKRGQAEANLPTLDPGEPAITFDSGGKLWIGTPSGNLEITGGGSGSPGAPSGSVQFNDGGSFGGATALIYDDSLGDFRIYGDGNNSLLHSDFSANTIGFGTNGATGTIAMFSPSIIVYNDDGQDVDFRVEGENFSNLFKVDAGLDAVQIGTAAAGTVADFRSSGTVFNDEGEDRDFRIEGATATNLIVIDAGLDAFQVGTTVAGAIADFRPAAIVFNNAEADVDFRIAGNGVTNAYIYDAGNNRHGFGTGTPSVTMEIVSGALSGTNLAPQIKLGVSAGEYQGFYSTAANVFGMMGGAENDGTNWVARHTSATLLTMAAIDGSIRFYTNTGLTAGNNFTPSERMRIYSNGNVSIEGVAGSLIVSRMTSTQRDALTAINGMVLYNTTTNKLQVRASGSWVDLH